LDNDELIVTEFDESSESWDIGLLALTGDHERRALLATKFNDWRPHVSRDGHWLAYQSDESGRWEIYVRPFPNVDAEKLTISLDGGEEPRWSDDGGKLFFLGPQSMMETVVGAGAGGQFTHGMPEPLFDLQGYHFSAGTPRRYDVSRDGQRFLLTRYSGDTTILARQLKVIVVTGWVEELERRVPAE
jgi:hypothetical protein